MANIPLAVRADLRRRRNLNRSLAEMEASQAESENLRTALVAKGVVSAREITDATASRETSTKTETTTETVKR